MAKKRVQEADAQFIPGHQDIIWLSGKVFTDRDFVDKIEEKGFESIYAECPYGDLTASQKRTFEDTFNRWEMRLLVRVWWLIYDYLRKNGKISATAPWRP